MANNRDLNIRLNADASGFERGFKSAEQSAKVFERELAKVEKATRDMAAQEAAAYREQEKMMREANEATATIGKAIGIGAGAIVAGLGAAVSTAADFDSAMSSVQAATGESTQSMGKLRDAALKAGADTVYSATEAAGAIEELAKAGVSTADILDGGLAGALNLAAAGGIEVADAAEAAASAMTQFGLSGTSVPHIADLLAAAAGKAQGGVSEMNYALSQSGLVAAQMGITIEQTTGTLAAFASAGLLGSDAGTSFKTMLLALANPSEKAANTMAELGINAYDAQGNFVGVAQLADQLKTKLGALSQEQRNAALATIFGSDAMRAAAVLYQQGGQGIEDWTSAVNDSGYASEVAATKLDNLKGDLEALQGSLQTAMITLGAGKLGAAARETAQELDHLIDSFNSMPAFVQSDIQVIGALAGGLGLLVSAAMLAVPKWDEFKDVMTRNARATNLATTAMRRYGTVTAMTALTVGAAILGTQIADHLNTASASADQTTNALMSIATGADVAQSSFDRFDIKVLGAITHNTKDAAGAVEEFGLVASEATKSGLTGFANGLLSLGDNERQFNNQVKDLDSALADMVQNGHADEAKAALDKLLASVGAQGGDVEETRGKFKLYAAALDSTATAAANAEQQVRFFSSAQSEATGIAQEMTEAEADLRKEMIDGINSFLDPLGAYTDALDAKQEAEQKSAQATADATKDGKDSWQDYAKDVNLSVEDYIAALQKQIDAQNNWSSNLLTLTARGLPNEIVQQLTEMGQEGAPIVQRFVDATTDEFNRMAQLWPRATGGGADAVADILKNAGPILKQIAEASGTAVAKGYADKLAAGQIGVQDVILDYRNFLDQNIPDEAETSINVDGVQVSRSRIMEIRRTMDQYLQDKTITITAAIRAATSALAGSGTRVAQGAGGSGGVVLATGGPVVGPGGPTEDAIPAWLSNGEYVINARQTARHRALLEDINSGRQGFATGGLVGNANVNVSLPNPISIRGALNSELAPLVAGVQKAADAAASSAAIAADSSEAVGQGSAAAGGQGSGWQWQIATLRKAFPGLGLNSAFRANSKTVSGNTSYHARGRAVDVPPRMDVFNWLLANYGNSPEIIYSPAGTRQIKNGRPHYYTGDVRAMHFNHVHWAYDQGGIARGKGMMPKLTAAPERVLSPRMTKDFERLVDLLGAQAFADGGLVSRGTRTVQGSMGQAVSAPSVAGSSRSGGLMTGQDSLGNITFRNGFDIDKYLAQMMRPVKLTVDDSDLRNANSELANWTSRLAMATEQMDKAKVSAEWWGDEVRNAGNDLETAKRNVENFSDDLTRAQKALADSQKDLSRIDAKDKANADRLADARQRVAEDTADLDKATTDLLGAQKDVTAQSGRLEAATSASAKATSDLNEATEVEASIGRTVTAVTEKQAAAERALNDAKAEALEYAKKIAAAAMSGTEVTGLFTAEDSARALEYAQNAYAASVAEGQAAKDATEYQSKIDQLAAAGQRLAAAQAAMGASYATQKATISGTRAEVERLALSYGFTAEQARALAESSVPLANTGDTLVASLERQLAAVTGFSKSVETLRALGLSQGLLDQILEAGPEKGMALAEEIIAGGTGMVKRLNDVQAALVTASNALGQSAANAQYGAAPALPSIGVVQSPQIISSNAPTITRGTRIVASPRPIIAHRAVGGIVTGPGGPTADQIPAYLSSGEFVIKAAAVERYGSRFFDGLNAMRYATGGLVSRATPSAGRPQLAPTITVAAGATGPQFNAPLFDHVTVRETVDADVLWQRAPLGLGPLGLGGGR